MAASETSDKNNIKLAAVKLLGTINLHQSLWLPQTTSHDRLRVSFSTTSNFDDEALPAILFCGPMFGSRYGASMYDKIARESGVRIICVDRPGIGGSTPAPAEQRLGIWLETVPALLSRLNVKHVSLVSHSAGTMYSLTTLYYLRDILDPVHPYVAYLGPFVHTAHSSAALLKVVAALPPTWIASFPSISEFFNKRIMPTTSWSGGILSSALSLFQAEPGANSSGESSSQDRYGVDEELGKEIERLQMKYLFEEGASGVGQEALLCAKKCSPPTWGICDDYEKYVQDLVQAETGRRQVSESAPKLEVDIYFAESDVMIGKGGREYFDRVWHQDGVSAVIDVQSTIMPKTDHETVLLDFRKGALRRVLEKIARNAT